MIDAVDGLEKDGVGEPNFRNPKTADDVSPTAVVRLFEGASAIRTETTFDRSRRGLEAATAEPLTLWKSDKKYFFFKVFLIYNNKYFENLVKRHG